MIRSDDLNGLSWDDFRIVRAISEAGNLAAAAAALGLNTSTMSRRLTQVESDLGTRLFERRRTGYRATASGAEVIALAERVELDIVSVAHRISGEAREYAGHLKIASNDSFSIHLLTPVIADFRKLYPAITLELLIGNTSLNLARGEADIALRATDTPPENLFGKRIATIGWAPYGCKENWHNSCLAPERLYEQTWVAYGSELSSLTASKLIETRVAPDKVVCRVDSIEAAAAAIAANIGLGYLPCISGDTQPRLTRVGPVEASISSGLWLLTHPDLRRLQRISAFMTFCASQLAKRRASIEGILHDDAQWPADVNSTAAQAAPSKADRITAAI
ncbi:LysR family transcriptional regulator [Rhizobium mayense]|uniref:LysR family transcriptional regulator n=1 Tax=Rhizobium mayense TaxID=1312184 RepID=A0ABT7K1P1_9HYPH|nr:LysR family transcriptional regulator [Rhizobium mayense]MDL2402524.1 LysR family transcriptional regulator [Rhizobium mayense]